MPWYRRDGQLVEGEKLDDVEFKPEKLKEELTTSFKTSLTEMQAAQDEKMRPILEMAAAMAQERADRAEAARVAAANANKGPEVTAEDFMLDPADAVSRMNRGTNTAVKMLAAKMNKQDALADKEYYHGDIKSKVDAMISQQTLDAQCRADVVENCYKLVMFDHMKDIQEGKIKSRNSANVFDSNSSSGNSGKSEGESETLNADEKLVAKRMGISEKDWITSRRQLEYV